MAIYLATVFIPGQPARNITANEMERLICPGRASDGLLTCMGQTTETLLGVDDTDVLAASSTAAVWGMTNAADYEQPNNPEAADAVAPWFDGLEELYGPILLVIKKS